MPVYRGGWPVYGVSLGIIMLDCRFPRPVGDIGNARTFPFPVQYEVLHGVPAADLTSRGTPAAVEALVAAARKLERLGVGAIVTSCGLLVRHQKTLAQAVGVPVASSALLMLPLVGALLGGDKKVAVITSKASSLPHNLLDELGWSEPGRVVIAGLEPCKAFTRSVVEAEPPFELDTETVYREVLGVCESIKARDEHVGAFLLECTNLGPYSARLRVALGLPVFDIVQLAHLLHGAVTTG